MPSSAKQAPRLGHAIQTTRGRLYSLRTALDAPRLACADQSVARCGNIETLRGTSGRGRPGTTPGRLLVRLQQASNGRLCNSRVEHLWGPERRKVTLIINGTGYFRKCRRCALVRSMPEFSKRKRLQPQAAILDQ